MIENIKTADEVVASIARHQAASAREKRQHQAAVEAERTRLEAYEDLRDDVMSLVKNSQLSYEDIHGRCGPHPTTLNAWANKVTHQPRLGKLQATLRDPRLRPWGGGRSAEELQMKQQDLVRAWTDVASNIDSPEYTLASVALTAGFLAGGDMAYSVATVIALAEKVFGHHPDLTALKMKIGLAGRIETEVQTPP